MPILLIRHGQKKWPNTSRAERGFDPPLAPEQFPDLEVLWKALLQLDEPAAVVASPYLRTRQTARLLVQNADLPDFSVDPRMSEFLGNQSPANTRPARLEYLLSESTLSHKPAVILNRDRYVRAAQRFPLDENCWYVTHGLFIVAVARKYGLDIEHPREFTGLLIEGRSAQTFDPWA